MQAYRIVDWVKLFEVTDKHQATKLFEPPPPIEKLRKSPLPHVRLQNTGFAQTRTDRRIAEKAWQQGQMAEIAVYGLYVRLLIIAAAQAREFRGWILDERQRPLDAKGIAEILGIYEICCVQKALGILSDPAIGLLASCEFRQASRKSQEIPKIPGVLYKETETEEKISKTKEHLEFQENPEIPGIPDNTSSASDFSSDVSASVSAIELGRKRDMAIRGLAEYIRPHNPSDGTTLRHIVNQITERIKAGECTLEIFNVMVETAKECNQTGRNPIAMFVKAMKQPRFGYVPQRERLIKHQSV